MEQSLSQYKTFYEVANAENISKAARILLISQPAVSKSIKKLESDLGIKLFDRTSVGFNLTPQGKLLYDHLTVAFNHISDAENQLKVFSNINFGHLRVGVSQTLAKHLLMPYINRYTREYPNIRLTITTMHAKKAYERLEEKRIDLALLHKEEKIYKNIVYMPIADIHDCFVASKDYLDYFNMVFKDNPDYFSQGNVILLDKKNYSREVIDRFFEENNIMPRQILEVNNTELLIDFAKSSVGIAGCIKEFVKTELDNKTLIEIPTKFKIPKRSVGFAYNKTNISRELKDFIDLVQNKKVNKK